MNSRSEVRKVLETLAGPISGIDGGCSTCIGYFCREVNEAFEREGIPFRLQYDREGQWPRQVEIITVEEIS